MLKSLKMDYKEGADGTVIGDKDKGAPNQGRMGTDARSGERQSRKRQRGWE
jgi:hypothetical protein